ncbi:MAG: Na/Pi cotransporter family protein [Lachnospiraceae bacterium]|nr:Na/Pi cotransporter family protein [Lachnospiraceae bacterium]
MTMTDLEHLFSFVGGLGMFLYGMNVMAGGLQKAAGNKMKNLMGVLTNNRLLAVLVGALVTAIIQSSSATTVMVVGFVNAGILNLIQAVGVIMGANVGTTITSWLVSLQEWGAFLKPEFLAPLFIGIGAFVMLFTASERKKDGATIAVGFGILFIGLSFMSSAIKPYSDSAIFVNAFRVLGKNPILGILVGALVTAIIQSSSASVGILQTLAFNGMVNWNSAVFIMLGQNIGTCVTALLSSVGANKTAKRAAVIHLLFNVIGAVVFGVLMFVIFMLNKNWASSTINSFEISIFHTIFNIGNTMILFPFAKKLVSLSGLFMKEEAAVDTDEEKTMLRHLDERIFETPSFAVLNAVLEVVHMGEITYQNVKRAFTAVTQNDTKIISEVYETEKTIDAMAQMISDYLVKINNLELNEEQHNLISDLFYTVSDIERIGDHAENLADLAEFKVKNEITFSESAAEELKDMVEMVNHAVAYSIASRKNQEITLADQAREYENQVDEIEELLRTKHIERLANNLCQPKAGVVFLDILSNLERISDHADNIAEYVENEVMKQG